MEIIPDRFNRRWYAISQQSAPESEPVTSDEGGGEAAEKAAVTIDEKPMPPVAEPTPPVAEITQTKPIEGGGVGEQKAESDQFITWEKADELGLKLPNEAPGANQDLTEFKPIDEL